MLQNTDYRLGCEIGLYGIYAELPAFEIVNLAHDLVSAFTAKVVTLKYASGSSVYTNDTRWSIIDNMKTEFNRRVNQLNADPVEAAKLAEEIQAFVETVLDPLIAAHTLGANW